MPHSWRVTRKPAPRYHDPNPAAEGPERRAWREGGTSRFMCDFAVLARINVILVHFDEIINTTKVKTITNSLILLVLEDFTKKKAMRYNTHDEDN